MCREKWLKMVRRNNANPFCMVYPEKGSRVVTSLLSSPIVCMKTATWSHSVNSEDFLVAEASDVLEMHLPDPNANLASIFCEATEGTRQHEAI